MVVDNNQFLVGRRTLSLASRKFITQTKSKAVVCTRIVLYTARCKN
ncbi:hypothetical protein PROVRETT_08755 [Providencia rettgeri DSM 1131]|nr:hypothetical protein PROVRETT_08755 [Providencia rettgeri DSM 1131]